MSGFEAPAIIAAVAGGVQIVTGIASAVAGSKATDQEAKFSRQTAQMEADAQREEDRHAAARARARQYSGVSVSSGSPLFDDLENSRRIQQRFNDRIFQGRIGAAQAKGRKPGIIIGGASQAIQGGLSIASGLYRNQSPRPPQAQGSLMNP